MSRIGTVFLIVLSLGLLGMITTSAHAATVYHDVGTWEIVGFGC